jgi:hypothetical protein
MKLRPPTYFDNCTVYESMKQDFIKKSQTSLPNIGSLLVRRGETQLATNLLLSSAFSETN